MFFDNKIAYPSSSLHSEHLEHNFNQISEVISGCPSVCLDDISHHPLDRFASYLVKKLGRTFWEFFYLGFKLRRNFHRENLVVKERLLTKLVFI